MKNTFKKVVSVICLTAFILSLSVFAVVAEQDIDATVTLLTYADSTQDTLNVSVTPDETDAWVTVVVTYENGKPLGISQQAASTTNDFSFSLSGVENQNIKVKISLAPSNVKKEITRTYCKEEIKQEAIQNVIDPILPITEEVIDPIMRDEDGNIVLDLGGDISLINDTERVTDGIKYLKDLLAAEFGEQDSVDVGTFVDFINDNIEISIFNSKNVNAIKTYTERENDSLGLDSTNEYGWYETLADVSSIYNKIIEKSYPTATDFVDEFKRQSFLQTLSTKHASNIISFLDDYADTQSDEFGALELDLLGYDALEDFQKTYFASVIAGIRHSSLQDLREDFEEKLETAETYTEGGNSTESDSTDSSDNSNSLGTITGGNFGGNGGNITPATPVPSNPVSFKDITTVPWANEAITSLAQAGVIHGVDGENFDPNGIVTKEQFVQIIVGAFGLKHNGNSVAFTDVPSSQWYSKSIEIAAVNGIVFGVNDTQFGLGTQITRQDMAAIIYRISKSQNITLTQITTEVPSDIELVPEYAREAVISLYQAGIIYGVGDGRFAPNDIATRAQAAKIIYELRRLV